MDLPPVVKVRQQFTRESIDDVAGAVKRELVAAGLADRIRPKSRVAITAGSRGITRIAEILKAVADEVKAIGAEPFLVPAMGSHGGATPEGQVEMLAGYDVTEAAMGVPILASMDTVTLGVAANGATVHFDRHAYEADATIVVGRVKAHTAFKGDIESGLCKMITVGLGKQKGAESAHSAGLKESVWQCTEIAIRKANVALGLGIVENSFDQPYRFKATPPEGILDTDRELLRLSNSLLPRVPFDYLDVLVVEWLGKNISGSGMDYNVVGMWRRIGGERKPDFKRIAVLNLTPESHGNAIGVGIADFCTRKIFDAFDMQKTYMNGLTAGAVEMIKIPPVMPTDHEAIAQAIKVAGAGPKTRLAVIHSTLHLEELYISESLLDEARANPALEIHGEPHDLHFDAEGNLRLAD
ncbi:MAG: DUF2088 domain-containing protein [Chloroflexi bacterium]|nr:DUF2088 domain-containing protein [Chloroflexota bacterium]